MLYPYFSIEFERVSAATASEVRLRTTPDSPPRTPWTGIAVPDQYRPPVS